jgi:hypothetical protein
VVTTTTTARDTPKFSWVAALSLVVGVAYPWIVVVTGPDRCEGSCELIEYAPAPVYAVAVIVSLRRGVLRGLAFGVAGAVLGVGAAFFAIAILLDVSGAT